VNKKIFFDINIVIDIIDEARTHHREAKKTIAKTIEEDYDIFVSEDMITTVFYILKGNPKVLYFFKSIIQRWNVVPFGSDVIEESIDFCIQNESDLEDTLQCMCARKNGCGVFLTSDRAFVACGINIMTYEEFLNSL
jgi:predicted nucleic acid-binding protein